MTTQENNSSYTVLIANQNGHDTHTLLTVEETAEKIVSTVETNRNWVFINGTPFEFSGLNVRSLENITRLQTKLTENPLAQILLTGEVLGG